MNTSDIEQAIYDRKQEIGGLEQKLCAVEEILRSCGKGDTQGIGVVTFEMFLIQKLLYENYMTLEYLEQRLLSIKEKEKHYESN